MDEQFAKTLKHLRLWGVLAHCDEYVALAEQQDFSPLRLLRHVLEEESKLHAANSRRLRLLRAKIPDPWRMETFPFERQPNLNKKRLLSLYEALSTWRSITTSVGSDQLARARRAWPRVS